MCVAQTIRTSCGGRADNVNQLEARRRQFGPAVRFAQIIRTSCGGCVDNMSQLLGCGGNLDQRWGSRREIEQAVGVALTV